MASNPHEKGVYKIVFPNGQFYIGSAYGKNGIAGRWLDHRKGSYSSPKYLQHLAAQSGGWDNVVFIVLKNTRDKHSTLLYEQEYVDKYWSQESKDPLLLNRNRIICDFEQPDMTGENNPSKRPNVRKKISDALLGHAVSDETKKKLSRMTTGRHHSEATKNGMSQSRRGANNTSAKLTWDDVKEIRRKFEPHVYTIKMLAEEYGMSIVAIARITSNMAWVIGPDQNRTGLNR